MEDAAALFMKYDYTETKELLKVFITLISGTLVFSVTFSEKVIGIKDASATAKKMLVISWGLLVFALICAGLAMIFIAAAAGKIIYGAISILNWSYWSFALTSWLLALVAGTTFTGGLIVMVFAGARSMGIVSSNLK